MSFALCKVNRTGGDCRGPTGERGLAMPKPGHPARLALAVTVLTVSLAACAPIVDQRGNLPDPSKLAAIEPGVTNKEAVSKLLGTPSSVSTFGDKTWYYISRRTERTAFFAPEVTDQLVVAVAFDDSGIVRGVERHNLADGRPIDPSPRETPSAGRELGFIEQLIGNLGRFNTDATKGPGGFRRPGTPGN
jgi:outer membrane protein assembly factor BamE (lipoprotein component of BamABCDE complex)